MNWKEDKNRKAERKLNNVIKYDREKLTNILLDEYHKATNSNGNPSKSMALLLDCMDDAFVDEYLRQISSIEDSIKEEAQVIQKEASDTLYELQNKITEEKDNGEIQDERVVDALKAYRTIVDMDFDTPQQKLQNIQNASYFIWALYAKESATANMFLKAITDVKKEDDSHDDGWWKTLGAD